jgi:hypothetical protein
MKKQLCNLLVATLCLAGPLSAQNLVKNGTFEKGTSNWSLFAPGDAKANNAALGVSAEGAHGGTNAAVLTATGPARYGMVTYINGHRFAPGQKYRLTAWVRGGADFQPVADTPGFLIRVTMYSSASGWDTATDGMLYLGAADKAVRGKDTSAFNNQVVPTEWTKLETEFVASPDTAKMNISIFVWKGSGAFYVDDVSLELLPAEAQPTAVAPSATTSAPVEATVPEVQ